MQVGFYNFSLEIRVSKRERGREKENLNQKKGKRCPNILSPGQHIPC
jgi:hypothetical protein